MDLGLRITKFYLSTHDFSVLLTGTEMHNTRIYDDIAVISASDTLPKYEDLPPSYEEVMSGTINFSFLDDPAFTSTDNQQTVDIQQTASSQR